MRSFLMIATTGVVLILAQVLLIAWILAFIVRMVRLIRANGLDVPYVPTARRHFEPIRKALAIRDTDVVYDLGCGSGRFLLHCAHHHKKATFVGIERNTLLFLQARIRHRCAGSPPNITFRRADFYTIDLTPATRIYTYLFPRIMKKLFADTSLPGVRLVSRAFPVPSRTPLMITKFGEVPGSHNQHLLYTYEL